MTSQIEEMANKITSEGLQKQDLYRKILGRSYIYIYITHNDLQRLVNDFLNQINSKER